MHKLKKMIVGYMRKTTLIMILVILLLSLVVQMLNEQRQVRDGANIVFAQIEHILKENSNELIDTKEEYSQTCLHNAESIAFIIEHYPEILENVEELRKIAEFSEVDEIHIFNDEGVIFTGTHPEYYNLSVDSGEQIGFFKPMLSDKSLKLCQEITPNTAEEKLMQYSALWSENDKFIVQVGMEPESVMKVMERNDISYVFSMLRVNPGVSFMAIDKDTQKIVGSTDEDSFDKNCSEIGLDIDKIKNKPEGFHAKVNDVNAYCIFREIDGNYVGRMVPISNMYHRIPQSIIGLSLCLVFIAIILVLAVSTYMNKYVIDGIYNINGKLKNITEGNLDEIVDVQSSVEFSELSSHINEMVRSILASTEKMSYVLDKTNMRVGVYEYNEKMKNVRFTEYIAKLLDLESSGTKRLNTDYMIFRNKMNKIHENPVPNEEGIYLVEGKNNVYVKIEEINKNNEILGVVIDVTNALNRRRKVENERDIDILTGLYSRRGIENRLSEIFKKPEKLGNSAIIMIDADGLKVINDKYGHEKGDIYLRGVADTIKVFDKNKFIGARWGGDEFVVLLYNYETEEELLANIDRLKNIQDSNIIKLDDEVSVLLRFSLGYHIIKGRNDYEEMLKIADENMYINKMERKKKVQTKL